MRFEHYQTGPFFDEMFEAGGEPRAAARALVQLLETMTDGELLRRQLSAERALLHMGITFNVYGDSGGTERIFPFDLVPRIVAAAEWNGIEQGLKQRIHALNLFIDDIYHDQRIVKDGVIPAEIISTASSFRKQCIGMNPPGGVWCHITGTDLVRDRDGQIYVLEDNLRCPSGVSYVLQNRVVDEAHVSAGVRVVADSSGRRLSQPAARHAGVDGRRQRRVAARRRPDPRGSQLGLLRALLPGPADGGGAGRRARPRRVGRLRLDAHDERIRAGRRDLPADRRRLPGPEDLPARFGAGRTRADGRLPGRTAWRSSTPRARAWPTTRWSTPTCPRW